MVEPVNIEWKKLGFKFFPTKFMFVATCNYEDKKWQIEGIKPYGNIEISPAAGVLNYGQGLFEGLKAYSGADGESVYLFRPEKNAERMKKGCERMCVPPLPTEIFLEAVNKVSLENKEYIPPYDANSVAQGSLYLRPVVWGTGERLGVAPAPSYTFVTYACPVGPYFKSGFETIKLRISDMYNRAVFGGTGGVKAIGNYAPGMFPAQMAKEQGFNEILYTDATSNQYIEEVGAANFFCVKDNTLFTPRLDGTILNGITRDSVIHIAKKVLGMEVCEEKISVEKIWNCDEAFASGTAAVIAPIGFVSYKDKECTISGGEPGAVSKKIYQAILNLQHGIGDDPFGWRYKVELGNGNS